MTELVSRALYDAMVAERDALAARFTGQAACFEAAQRSIERLSAALADRDAQLTAAHGLQARAERAEAAVERQRQFILGFADTARLRGCPEIADEIEAFAGPAALAS